MDCSMSDFVNSMKVVEAGTGEEERRGECGNVVKYALGDDVKNLSRIHLGIKTLILQRQMGRVRLALIHE
jgi:hypothetical protein